MAVKCYLCKHFRGLDIDGYVHCAKRGQVRPMLICPFFEERLGQQ